MAEIIDYTTEVGQMRLLLADTDPNSLVLTDEQVEGYLAIERHNLKRAAAAALDAIASSEALVSKVITTQDRSTDGAKVADALRKHAAALRARADAEEGVEEESFFLHTEPHNPAKVEGEEWRR
jgi:hypothetical protein